MKKQTKVILIVGGIVLLVAVLVISVSLYSGDQNDNLPSGLRGKWNVAQRLLSEAKYEEAILAFEEIISVEPRYVPAYHALSEAYGAVGNDTASWQALYRGYGVTGDETLATAFMNFAHTTHSPGLEETSEPSPVPTEAPTSTHTSTTTPTSSLGVFTGPGLHEVGARVNLELEGVEIESYEEWVNDHQWRHFTRRESPQTEPGSYSDIRITSIPLNATTHSVFYTDEGGSNYSAPSVFRDYWGNFYAHDFRKNIDGIEICWNCGYAKGYAIPLYEPPFDPSETNEAIEYSTE